jgi:glycosyltransferase involved in cell wall biosynthesis
MRIAQVSPLFESVPPKRYGGTERVVFRLCEALIRLGHEVTLFASGDSEGSANLVPVTPRALRDSSCRDPLAIHMLMIEQVLQRADEFDVIHWHTDYIHLSAARRLRVPSLSTLHGRLDLPHLVPLYQEFCREPLVSISNAQRGPLPFARWIGTVYHGLPIDAYRFHPRGGEYLLFLGRISREKRPDRAIAIADRLGMPLKIAAKIDNADKQYHESEVLPLLERSAHAEFLGEVGEAEKEMLMGGARALLFPIDWPEPFGLVMIESLACGTPVIAFRNGSVPEVIDHGRNGFIVESIEEAVRAVERVDRLDRAACRADFERRFVDDRMAIDYLALYEELAERAVPARGRKIAVVGGGV